ncbi:hypothetical protein DSCO28_09350 [Desulfosarcina ovata subsp. sediminis]|uniref:Uncharacterized protein n=1 Tax=Desulfosarcina ovata subsp. sediminis TaxID=885957 RepID=A0A5K7ZL60_9BACT|nr:hypothetical protein [Desulfosarcina ovata]BBO80369.1 hypothetical protein DSCO28_09350 [Desulfosarcina ovata subsp. sediminis]
MDINHLSPKTRDLTRTTDPTLSLRAGDRFSAAVLEVGDNGRDAMIAFGRFQAYARLPLPVVTGQEINLRVISAGQGLRLVMVPPDGGTKSAPAAGALTVDPFEMLSDKSAISTGLRALTPGSTLQGRITGFAKDGQLLVDFGEFKAFAKVDIPVRQGQTLMLSVNPGDQGLSLSVAGAQIAPGLPVADATAPLPSPTPGTTVAAGLPAAPGATEMNALREAIGAMLRDVPQAARSDTASVPVQSALENLQQILRPVSPGDGLSTLMERVKSFVENSGIYFEKRLESIIRELQPERPSAPSSGPPFDHPAIRNLMETDLKPNLLVLKQFLDFQTETSKGSDRAMLETMKSVVDRALANIDQQHHTATEKPVSTDVFQSFSHLLFLTDPNENARLKVYYARKGRDDDQKPPRVSLLLDMDRMGTVRSDLWMVGKDLNITFFVKDTDIKTAIESTHQQIKAMLSDTFNTVAISVVVSEKKIAQFDGEDLMSETRSQVDVTI